MTPYQGQHVLYTLAESDAEQIRARRAQLGISGNSPAPGEVCPAVVVRLWNPTYANLKVFLDGQDDFWATSRYYGTSTGCWRAPDAQGAEPEQSR